MKIQLYQAVKKNRWNLQELNSVENHVINNRLIV